MSELRTGVAARIGSLTDRNIATARDVLAGRSRGPWGYLAFVGPAVVASVAYVDPGNFATNIQAGAKYGYELLWVVLARQSDRHAVPGAVRETRHRHRA